MAKLTFSGTTQEVLLAITATDIDSNTKITITDNDYTLANLLTIVGTATTYPVVLQKTAAAVAIEGTAINLITMLAGVSSYTGALKATDVAGVSAAQLNTIAAGTTGKVTATLVNTTTIDAATVALLKDVKATDAITFVPTDDTLLGNAEINALISLNKILPKADWSSIDTIEGTANDVSIIKQALAIAKNPALTVEITAGIISAEDANAIAKLAGGALTATIKAGSVAETLKALANVDATDALTFTSTDKTVKATDLVALNSKIDTGTYTSIETITADAKDVSYVSPALAIATGADVTITGTITAAQANAIAANVNAGDITAIVEADTAANLVAKLANTTPTDILTLGVNGTTATAANLNTLATKTGGKIKLDATEVTGNVTALTDLYVTNKVSFTALGNENVTIITGPNPTAAELNTIAAGTAGKVTATLVNTTTIDAATVALLKDVKATDAITFTPTDDTLSGNAEINALISLNKILPKADWSAIDTIEGSANDVSIIKQALAIAKNPALTVEITAGQIISAADANAIAKLAGGALTAEIQDGTVAATLKALSDVKASDVLTFTSTDKTVKATDLVALNSKIANGTYSSIETITGDAKDSANIATALTIATHPEVKISGIIDVADINAILTATNKKVTAKIKADTATNLVAVLNGSEENALDVTVNGATAAATALADIDDSTSLKVKVDAAKVTGEIADLNKLYYTNKANFSNLGNENVEIVPTGPATTISALNVDSILKATTGVVTAAVTDDKANILVSQLKNANAKDDLDITVLTDANGTSAKDLIALTKKTSFITGVDASAITTDGIVGSVADINAVIKANTDGKLGLAANVAYSVAGTITAAQANAIANETTGVVTANIAAGTAKALNDALDDSSAPVGGNAYTLKVNGATAAASDLIDLNGKTTGKITVDAKEITGSATNVNLVLNAVANFIGKEKVAVNITDPSAVVGDVNTTLGLTSGIVTATIADGTAAALKAALVNATAKDKLTLAVTNVAATAADLLALDDKTAVKVNATAITTSGISGSAADVKKLLASKGVELAKDVNITLSDFVVKAADVSAVAKATSGVVTAKVEADTAAKLNAALTDKDVNALTLTVNGTTATAKDLISLNGKTSVPIVVNVGAITGNIAEITDVFVTNVAQFTGVTTDDATISGTVSAGEYAALNTILAVANTTGVVTATIQANDAATLNTTFTNANATDKLSFKVNGTTAAATDLTGLDAKTDVAVDASAIKNIEGTATAVKAAYDANISGLGNETVDLSTATDANASLVKAINDYTTGVITLDTLNTAATGGNFSLSQLGDLNGITGLVEINAVNTVADTINISLKDLLAANDGKGDIAFLISGDNLGSDTVAINDYSGWTVDNVAVNQASYTFTNNTTNQEIVITLTDISGATVI